MTRRNFLSALGVAMAAPAAVLALAKKPVVDAYRDSWIMTSCGPVMVDQLFFNLKEERLFDKYSREYRLAWTAYLADGKKYAVGCAFRNRPTEMEAMRARDRAKRSFAKSAALI